MIKTVIRVIYSALISVVLISIILAAWTGYAFFFQPTKSSEIFYFIKDIYESQKTVIVDVVDLSKLLLKDINERKANKINNFEPESKSLTLLKGSSQLDQSSIVEDNGNNPLGIVIQPSSYEVREDTLPEISEEPLIERESELSMNKMERD